MGNCEMWLEIEPRAILKRIWPPPAPRSFAEINGRATASAQGGKRVTLRLKVPKRARKVAARALAAGGKARAKLSVRATTTAGGKSSAKRTIRLRG